MSSPNKLLPKFTSLLAIGACLLTANHLLASGKVAAGFQFGGAISDDGKLRTWGLNDSGQLGQGPTAGGTVALPTVVAGTGASTYSEVEAGPNFMLGISTEGVLKSWGNNASGQLGIGTLQNQNTPQVINFLGAGEENPKIKEVAAGTNHVLAITQGGALYAWGDTSSGQLGIQRNGIGYLVDPDPEDNPDSDDADTFVERPFLVTSANPDAINTWKDVAAGYQFSVGIKSDGTLWIWGAGANQFGASGNFFVPQKVGTTSDWVDVEAGTQFVIARRGNGQIYTWGSNAGGVLGIGNENAVTKSTPTRVGNRSDWIDIGAGDYSAFAIDSSNQLYAWGLNTSEELGQEVYVDIGSPGAGSYKIISPTLMSPGNLFYEVDGGRGDATNASIDTNEGFTLTDGFVNQDGFFTFGGNASGQLGIGVVSSTSTHTASRAAADGLEIAITRPAVDSLTTDIVVGVNTLHSVVATVSNSGEVPIATGYTVELYLSSEDSLNTNFASKLAEREFTETLNVGASNTVTFEDILIGNLNGGDYYLYSVVTLDGTSAETNDEDNTGRTQISVREPNILLSNIQIPGGDQITLPNSFEDVTLNLSNNALGVIPDGTDISVRVYLSDNNTLDSNDILLSVTPTFDYSSGLGANDSVVLGPSDIAIPTNVSSGQKFLIFIADQDGQLLDSNTGDNQVTKLVSLFTPERIDRAIDYGYYTYSGNGDWASFPDNLASGGLAYISPTLAQTESATIATQFIGPTTINVPWRIQTDPSDNVTINVSGGAFSYSGTTVPPSSDTISGYVPTYRTNEIILEDNAVYDVEWTYNQVSPATQGFALLDLDIPLFRTSGDGLWGGFTDITAPIGDRSVRSPDIEQGQNASFEVDVIGPALVTFWVKTDSDPADTLNFLIDGEIASLPTQDFNETTQPATFSGASDWKKVAFLIEGGPRNLRWLFTKGSDALNSYVYVDGLSISKPIREENDPNRNSDPDPAYELIPQFNVDLAIEDVVATPGDYILDDSQGTGRLPITVVVGSVGSDFDVTDINADFASNIEVRLSLDTTYGNADDVILGSYAETQKVNQGDKIVLSAEINLPFDTPAGNYNIFVRFLPPPVIEEFSYANNTSLIGPGFIIIRAPDLTAGFLDRPSGTYPFHPEDTVPLKYFIRNRGLGTITLDDTFDVQVSLFALERVFGETEPVLIKTYDAFELSVFLPEVSATFPNGGQTDISQFITLPTLRDILVALGEIPAGTAEDDGEVTQNQNFIGNYIYYFGITLDSSNNILESSESNFFAGAVLDPEDNLIKVSGFSVFPTPGREDYGSYTSQLPFSDAINPFMPEPDLSFANLDTDDDDIPNLLEYALATDPTQVTPIFQGSDAPAPYGQVLGSYNIASLTIPPATTPQEYLTMTFDFNVRADDITITLEAADGDMIFDEDILVLEPPYTDDFGPKSLTGFNGLKDNPLVISVDGNVSATQPGGTGGIQKVYSARITVRDSVPLEEMGGNVDYTSRFMRIVVESALAAPGAPTNLNAGYNGGENVVQLSWTPDNAANPAEGGSFQILRSVGSLSDFIAVGSTTGTSFIDRNISAQTAYTYKVRLVNSFSASGESNEATVVVP